MDGLLVNIRFQIVVCVQSGKSQTCFWGLAFAPMISDLLVSTPFYAAFTEFDPVLHGFYPVFTNRPFILI